VDKVRPEARGPLQERGLGRSPHLPPSNAAFEEDCSLDWDILCIRTEWIRKLRINLKKIQLLQIMQQQYVIETIISTYKL
jgi:hypothetical protein